MNTILDETKKALDAATTSPLMDDFNMVVADVEALLKETASQSGEKFIEIRNKVDQSIKAAKASMAEAEEALLVKSKVAAKATDAYVHDHPWQSVGLAAGIGYIIGWLSARR